MTAQQIRKSRFQSTLPVRGATRIVPACSSRSTFQSTLPVRGATARPDHGGQRLQISIHAPRAGSDDDGLTFCCTLNQFQSTLPVRGATRYFLTSSDRSPLFQSTLPVRGATATAKMQSAVWLFQSTLPVRGATILKIPRCYRWIFQSTLPVRGATFSFTFTHLNQSISIHAPRAGSDKHGNPCMPRTSHFNPRSPCGERLQCGLIFSDFNNFNPRSPCGERPLRRFVHHQGRYDFNPRSPCGERRLTANMMAATPSNFNPRSPCGERQQYIVLLQVQSAIYTQSAILSIVNAIKGRRLLIEFGAKACGISCVLQIRTHKTSGSSTEIVSFEP